MSTGSTSKGSAWGAALPVFGVVGGAATLVALGCAGIVAVSGPCWRTALRYGIWAKRCPAGELRLTADVYASNLVRGGRTEGAIHVEPVARWMSTDDRGGYEQTGTMYRGFSWTVDLVNDRGEVVADALSVKRRESPAGGETAVVTLADVPDGEYLLRATVKAPFETVTTEAPLALFAPALVHVMSDRPLYKPGQTVLFRSAMLRRTDESPIEDRIGRWRVTDPLGNEVLVERGRSGPWGIAASSFPLDEDAPQGTWRVTWQSGADQDQATFEVRPFRLPRFSVEVAPSRAWYAIGEEVVVEGRAKYASGAPIGGAPATVTLRPSSGRWPMPLDWETPREITTAPDGRFRVSFGPVPPDLMDLAKLGATVEVVEAAGERVSSGATVILSHERLVVEAVTEFGNGLVEKYNNRAYLRVTTPDGRPVADADLLVRRPYDPLDPGKAAKTDADGVAAVQIDPGAPVSVVTPAAPLRVRPVAPPKPSRRNASEIGGSVDLEESRAFDAVLLRLDRCSALGLGAATVDVGVRVGNAGTVTGVVAGPSPRERCVADAVRTLRVPPGPARSYETSWDLPEAPTPFVRVDFGGVPDALAEALSEARDAARPCLAGDDGEDVELARIHWMVQQGSTRVDAVWDDLGTAPKVAGCVRARFAGPVTLDAPASASDLGVAVVSTVHPYVPGAGNVPRPQPTVTTGYELRVAAAAAGEDLGSGRVVLPPGAVPSMRIRPTPPLAHPGDTVTFDLVTGPGWTGGKLPEKLELELFAGSESIGKAEVVDKSVSFVLPPDADGFVHLDFAGARGVVFVSPAAPLTLDLATDRATYAPGDHATLTVTTKHGADPVAAGVSLVGVDAMLGQLAPLVGPDDFGRVTVRARSDQPAFGAFDARALALGQIRGENAARAAVLRVSQLPNDPAGDQPASANGTSLFEPQAILVENFYRIFDRASGKVAAWEEASKDGDLLRAEDMVEIWAAALDEVEDAGDPVVDGYGRRLRLRVLPQDFVALLDPRKLVSDATRIPEDAEDFVQYVLRTVR